MSEAENRRLDVKIQGIDVIYYSLVQAGFPLLESIVVSNPGEEVASGVRIVMETEFDFLEKETWEIAEVEAKSFVEIEPKLSFHARTIFELSEKATDTMTFRIYVGEELVVTERIPLTVLPVNQWSGARAVPETIASFVMPNVPEVSVLVARASEILKSRTGDPSFTGYLRGDKNAVLAQLSAIYGAIYEQNIVYSVDPPSFEAVGQRVRTPQNVLSFKQGNCIEMSVLFASVCEAVGLNPLLVFTAGHAFAGCWLTDELFDTTVEPNVGELNKRLVRGINDLVVLESTYMNQGMGKDFDQAMRAGLGNLERPENFHFVVDVRRCHYLGITPMPVRMYENGQGTVVDYGYAQDSEEKAVVKTTIEEYFLDTSKKERVTKSTIWMRNLLDLSKRNSLISFRPSVRNIQLFTSDIGMLEDALAKGDSFTLTEVTGSIRVNRKTSRIVEVENEKELILEVSKADFKAKKIRTFMEEEEMLYVLKSIYRETQQSIEENGASSLFLALGFLKWSDPKDGTAEDGSSFFRLAPLILIPVELRRKNLRSYSLRLRDEDAQMNITLLEFLRQRFELSITGLNPLPEDESGVDVPLVLNSIRKAVMNNKGWDVVETSVLGHFSFSQFVMWNDLKERFDQLTENKVVRGLVEGLYLREEREELRERDLDEKFRVSDLVIPTDVDSSQLAAVIEAAKGESFVLHGPPGTGKSQTITNMIANALYQGKSVLFVAEKMAALNVVYERLSKIGLEDFCLEIHSNKTSRRTVLEKFENNLNLTSDFDPGEYVRKSERIQHLKEQLNLELLELHKRTPQGYSVFELISSLERWEKPMEGFRFTDAELDSITRDSRDNLVQAVKLIAASLRDLKGHFCDHPLKDLEVSEYSYGEEEAFLRSLQTIERSAARIEELGARAGGSPMTFMQLGILCRMAEKIRERNMKTPLSYEMWLMMTDPDFLRLMSEFLTASRVRDEKRREVEEKYSHDIERVDISEVKENYLRATSAFLLRGGKIKAALLPLNAVSKNGHMVTEANAAAEFTLLAGASDAKREVEEAIRRIERMLCYTFDSFDKEDAVADLYEFAGTVRECGSMYGVRESALFEIYSRLPAFDSASLEELGALMKTLPTEFEVVKSFAKRDWLPLLRDERFSTKIRENVRRWTEHRAAWKEVAELHRSLQLLDAQGFSAWKSQLLERLRLVPVDAERLEESFLYSLTEQLIRRAIERNEALRRFSRLTTEERIREYNRLVSDLEEIGRQQIRDVLIQQLPNRRTLSREESVELAGLTKAIRSKGRGMSIRKLFQENSRAVKSLTPCMLMSPLSVAQYIDLSFPKFDLVIFDEASQIRTGIAVGAMSRAENCIIVGDPNQMPPTSFFSVQKPDEENLQVEDLESLLEDCLAINMPQKHLTCHYRSESESLIAFSNGMYYKNRMLTFPSPFDSISKVMLRRTDGIYERGGTRTNRLEAEAVVAEIVRRLKSGDKSIIGVVTFNAMQQELIDDLLQNELAKDRALERTAQGMREPIFVKNLENVQGDERDIIFFSVTFGKDETGKFYQNFGPLGKKGGWRRLNVAVTESRQEMTVFSSIGYDEFNIGAATPEGVIGLQKFLEYAEKGVSSLNARSTRGRDEAEEITDSIRSYLKERGYETEERFGASDLSLEIVVKNPKDPERFLCAILLDGKRYAALSTMRDRNRLVPRVLERKGWRVCRVWTLAYFENREKTLAELKATLDRFAEEAERREEEKREEVIVSPTDWSAPMEVPEESEITEEISKEIPSEPEAPEPPRREVFNRPPETGGELLMKHSEDVDGQEVYRKYEGDGTFRERSVVTATRAELVEMAEKILAVEAPMTEELLIRRVVEQFRDSKVTSNMRQLMEGALASLMSERTQENGSTVYFGAIRPESYGGSRAPSEEVRRELEMIPLCEIRNRYTAILRTSGASSERDERIRETVRFFGFSRVTSKIGERVAEALRGVSEEEMPTGEQKR